MLDTTFFALADYLLIFSPKLFNADCQPSENAVRLFWQQFEDILGREVEVSHPSLVASWFFHAPPIMLGATDSQFSEQKLEPLALRKLPRTTMQRMMTMKLQKLKQTHRSDSSRMFSYPCNNGIQESAGIFDCSIQNLPACSAGSCTPNKVPCRLCYWETGVCGGSPSRHQNWASPCVALCQPWQVSRRCHQGGLQV